MHFVQPPAAAAPMTSGHGNISYGLEVSPSPVVSAGKRAACAYQRGVNYALEVLAPETELRGWFLPPPETEIRGIRAVNGGRVFVARRKQLRPEVLAEHPDQPQALFSGFSIAMKLGAGWNRLELQFKDSERKWRPFCRCDLNLPWYRRMWRAREARPVANNYEAWSRKYGDPDEEELLAMRRYLECFPRRPLLSVLMPIYRTPERWLRRAIESLQAQVYPEWELCIADDCSGSPELRTLLHDWALCDSRIKVCFREEHGHISQASNTALEMCTGEFTVLLDHDDELPPHALFHIAWELVTHPSANIIFSDEDKIDEIGVRTGPYFKPGWNYDLLLGQNCVSHLGAFRTSVLREIGGFRTGFEGSQDWDVALRVVAHCGPDAVRHIPRMLYHWRTISGSAATGMDAKPYAAMAGRKAVEEHLRETARGAELLSLDATSWRILWPLPEPRPLVTLIIPTKDRADLIHAALESHFAITDYPRVEIILVDHDSRCRMTRAYLDRLRLARTDLRIVRGMGPFNWSALSNLGARESTGEVLVFLHNDVEIIASGWLDELVRQACRPDVGAVGGCLMYPDGTIQHAGMVLHMAGLAGHVFKRSPVHAPSIGGPPDLVREVTAVSGACLAVRREFFERVGGFDAENLPVSYHDVDFCLRLRRLGLKNIYTPFAQVMHRESASHRALEATSERRAAAMQEAHLLLERWPQEFAGDRLFNPNLSLHIEIPVRSVPRMVWPWLDRRRHAVGPDQDSHLKLSNAISTP